MNLFEPFRDKQLAERLVASIKERARGLADVNLMEVCGTHTMSIYRFGLKNFLPPNIRLLSGPGCPVCVTPVSAIDYACALSRLEGVTIATFGDMLRVPGSASSLEKERASGARIEIVYSPLDALDLASKNADRTVVFLGVGFETTAPAVALTIKRAKERGARNFFVFVLHKLIPPAMEALLSSGEIKLHGFICPAHVSAVIGARPYEKLIEKFHVPCVIAGFEPLDILGGIDMLLGQIRSGKPSVEIEYSRVVRREGNTSARAVIDEVFEARSSDWRGLGAIPASGLALKRAYREFDAESRFPISVPGEKDNPECLCGAVLRGVKTPTDCPLFGSVCTPEHPRGACMVSSEGTCSAWYKYTDDHR
ncbi:MAG: hydrogenase formation protein HypD [Candidatus Omnitrophica bacterium]|nr:hydrogenase formation protein HypD [Candidatus Omnitrophota bacterium]